MNFSVIMGPRFSGRMLDAMIEEVTRVRDKYSQEAWADDASAQRLVELLNEQLSELIVELGDVNSGARNIRATDIMMPDEREELNNYLSQII